jgi:hypothetical protein
MIMKAWIEAYAAHVRKRFGSRVVLRARIGEADPVDVCQLYALEGGGLVLVAWCGHDEGCTGRHHHHAEGHDHGAGEGHNCQYELWLASPERVVFEAQAAEEGKLCTGFGYLGVSRTPQVLVPRSTERSPERGHEHRDF